MEEMDIMDDMDTMNCKDEEKNQGNHKGLPLQNFV